MPLVLADRVRDTTTTTGTGTVTLSGTAPAGYQNLSVIGNGNTTYYTINAGSQWEVGIGTYSSTGPTLSRDTVLESSNANALVSFSAGTKDVFVTYPSDKAVIQDASGNVGIGTSSPAAKLNVAAGGTSARIRITDTDSLAADGTMFLEFAGTNGRAGYLGMSAGGFVLDGETTATRMAFSLGGSERMRITSAGNVGIGTTAPITQLQISAAASSSYVRIDNTNGVFYAGVKSTGEGYLSTESSDPLTLATVGVERMRLDTAGNVLVGTTTANGRLSVVGDQISIAGGSGSGNLGLQLRGTALNAIPAAQVQGYVATGDSGMGVAGDLLIAPRTSVAASIRFITGTTPTERVRIDGSGNVGVGTTAPVQRLTVQRDAVVGDGVTLNLNNPYGYGLGVGTAAATLRFNRSPNNAGSTGVMADISGGNESETTSTSGYLAFATRSGASEATTERMRIGSSGNVGIGTSSPGGKLQSEAFSNGAASTVIIGSNGSGQASTDANTEARLVLSGSTNVTARGTYIAGINVGGTVGGNNHALAFATSGAGAAPTERVRIDASGNVGIGTSSPSARLEVSLGAEGEYMRVGGDNAANARGLRFTSSINGTSNGALHTINAASGQGAIAFATGSTERMRIDSSGNVGIGTSSPAFRLVVAGAVQATDYRAPATSVFYLTGDEWRFRTTTGTERMRIDGSGNVGIGTTTPGAKLSVAGRADFGISTDALVYLTNAANAVRGLLDVGTSDFTIGASGGGVPLIFSTAAAERMRITDTGLVGIGTAAPTYPLDVTTTGAQIVARLTETTATLTSRLYATCGTATGIFQQYGQSHATFPNMLAVNASSGELSLWTLSVERLRIDSAGRVGIGTTSMTYPLDVRSPTGAVINAQTASGNAALRAASLASGSARLELVSSPGTQTITGGVGSVNNMVFSVGAVERMRIDASGKVGIGTSSPSETLTVAGRVRSAVSSGTIDIYHDGTNGSLASNTQLLVYAGGANNMIFHTNGIERFRITSTGSITSADLADAVGYKGIPQNTQTAAYTLALSDIGKHISITTGGVTIPANGTVAFPVGSAVTIYNNSASDQTISITTDTLRLAGTATTGSRTLAQRGICTCVKVAATEWVISGAGLT